MKKNFIIFLTMLIIMTTCSVAEKGISLGSSAVNGYNSSTDSYEYVYYGAYDADEDGTAEPTKWRVLDTTSNDGSTPALFVLSEYNLKQMQFGTSKTWSTSSAKTFLNSDIAASFNDIELSSIMSTTKTESGTVFYCEPCSLSNEKLFLLSGKEATTEKYGFLYGAGNDTNRVTSKPSSNTSASKYWWLRSGNTAQSTTVGYVTDMGSLGGTAASSSTSSTLRPAMNINPSQILFTSPAVGGKSTTVGTLSKLTDTTTTEHKLTLLDIARVVWVGDTSAKTVAPGGTISLECSSTHDGANEYISVILVKDGEAVAYGRLANATIEGETLTFTLPAGLELGEYELKVFSEECYGDYMTDYASEFVTIPLTVTAAPEKSITLGNSAINGYNSSTDSYEYIYYGINVRNDEPIQWRVLDTTSNDGTTPALFVLSEYGLEQRDFDSSASVWANSNIKDYLQGDFLTDSFSTIESNSILSTSVTDQAIISYIEAWFADCTLTATNLTGEKIFLLSGYEVENTKYGLSSNYITTGLNGASSTGWFLRNIVDGSDLGGDSMAVVWNDSDYIDGTPGSNSSGNWLRPAMNIDPSQILFTSPAVGGKSNTVGTLSKLIDTTTTEHKLTLQDSIRGLWVADTSARTVAPGGMISFECSSTHDAPNEYISVILVKDGEAVAYGRLANATLDRETITFTLPNDIELGEYELKVFSEECNGDYMTDYASEFVTIPLTVTAEPEKSITLGSSAINGYSGIENPSYDNGYEYIYFGNDAAVPTKWRVLDTTSNDGVTPALFVLRYNFLSSMAFDASSNPWPNSDIKTYLQGEYYNTHFTEREKEVILTTTKTENEGAISCQGMYIETSGLTAEKVFLLSAEEAINSKYGFSSDTSYEDPARKTNDSIYSASATDWWLRSSELGLPEYTAFVTNGKIDTDLSEGSKGIVPAMNIDPSQILFTSPAVGGKSNTTVGTLEKLSTVTTNEYKLTLLVDPLLRNEFAVYDEEITAGVGEQVTISYGLGDFPQENLYISAIIEKDGELLYYGRIEQLTQTRLDTDVLFTVPEDIAVGEYNLKLFIEQYNGDYMTDYASEFVTISLTVTEPVVEQEPEEVYLMDSVSYMADNLNQYNSTTGKYDYVYYGKYNGTPIKWRVLETWYWDDNYMDAVRLLSEYVLEKRAFDADSTDWATSDLRTYLNGDFLTNSFTTLEQKFINTTTTSDDVETEADTGTTYAVTNLADDRVYLLSVNEAMNTTYGFSSSSGADENRKAFMFNNHSEIAENWWLRNSSTDGSWVASVFRDEIDEGYILGAGKELLFGVRPAINIDQWSILFTSAAVGGKSTTVGSLEKVSKVEAPGYKFTMYDNSRSSFSIGVESWSEKTVEQGGKISINYSGATVGDNEYISALLMQNSKVVYYGKLLKPTTESGTLTFNVNVPVGDYEIYVYSEQCNGDYETDYASREQCFTLLVRNYNTNISLDTDVIRGYDSESDSYEYVYYGIFNGDPIKWRVLDTISNDGSTPAIFMLSEYVLESRAFDASSNPWPNSDIKTYLQGEYYNTHFTEREKEVFLTTTKTENEGAISCQGMHIETTGLTAEKVFLLSAEEAINSKYGFSNDTSYEDPARKINDSIYSASATDWWLRSSELGLPEYTAFVTNGKIDTDLSEGSKGIVPAMNIDSSAILFTSPAVAGKPTTIVGELNKLPENSSAEYKVTLVDSTRAFVADTSKIATYSNVTAKKGETLPIKYTGATIGANEYISAMIIEDKIPIYYGRLLQPITEDGELAFTVPKEINNGSYQLYLFSEQYNGDYMTDLASNFTEIYLTVETEKTSITLDADAVDGYTNSKYEYVYYGTYNGEPIKWRVLDKTSNDGSTPAVFMLSEYVLGQSFYSFDSTTNDWDMSELSSYMNGAIKMDSFTSIEQEAMLNTTTNNDGITEDKNGVSVEASNLSNYGIFALSASEATNFRYGFANNPNEDNRRVAKSITDINGSSMAWWLRSGSEENEAYGTKVGVDGSIVVEGATATLGARPAMNLNPSKVLFSSPAVGGKPTTTEGALNKLTKKATTEHKLTILDSSRSFAVAEAEIQANRGEAITITYSGATVGTDEYISAMVVQDGTPIYYGRIVEATSESGELSFIVPSTLLKGEYTLNVFSEKYNGDYMTDYASEMQDIKLLVDSEKTNTLGIEAIDGYNSETKTYEYVYYGTYEGEPIKWRVLDNVSNDGTTPAVFMLSEYTFGYQSFGLNVNAWTTSNIRTYLQGDFYENSFVEKEKNAVLSTTTTNDFSVFTYDPCNLTNDTVFLLSAYEVTRTEYGFDNTKSASANRAAKDISEPTGSNKPWWLRSPATDSTNYVAYICMYNTLGKNSVNTSTSSTALCVRPAFNLDATLVLFTSPAVNGKPTSVGTLEKQKVNTTSEYKVTIIDSARSFAISEITALTIKPSETVSVTYSGATVGANEYISAMLVKDATPVYYGRLLQATTEAGTLTFTIPSDIELGEYTLKLFSEQYNGDYKTDYASNFVDIALTISNSYTVTFDENGHGTAPGPIQVPAGGSISLPANPVEDGWQFEGWYTKDGTDGDWGDKVTGSTVIDKDTVIYGKWEYVGSQTSIMNGDDAISGYNSVANTYDYIYYGTYNGQPIKWRVLDTTSNDGTTGALFILTDDILEERAYNSDESNNDWLTSDIKAYIDNTFVNNFTTIEKSLIIPTYTTDRTVLDAYELELPPQNLTGEQIFLLSGSEATSGKYGSLNVSNGLVLDGWWLRNDHYYGDSAPLLFDWGIDYDIVNYDEYGFRPAMNIDPSKILFTSAAVGGKPTTTLGTLEKIVSSNTSEHKLTLLDSSREFVVTDMSDKITTKGGIVTVNYTGADVGTNEYISAMIVKNYGKNLVNVDKDYRFVQSVTIDNIFLEEGKTYYFSGELVGNTTIRIVDENDNDLMWPDQLPFAYTCPSDVTHIYLYSNGYSYFASEGIEGGIDNFQIEEGYVATSYEPHSEPYIEHLYYGRVYEPTTANGSFTFNVPEYINNGEYTLRVFSEQYNGDYKTDYASNFVDINLTVDSEPVDITLGTGAVDGYNSSTNSYEYVYYGTFDGDPIKWRVLDTTSNDGSTPAIFVLSEYMLEYICFDNDSNDWETSDIRTYLQGDFYNTIFAAKEKNAILSTTTTNDKEIEGAFGILEVVNLTGEKIFLLSGSEVTNTKYGFSQSDSPDANRVTRIIWEPVDSSQAWLLRSSCDVVFDEDERGTVGVVGYNGNVGFEYELDYDCDGLRPAMNLDPSKILFTSPAVGGKPTTTVGQLDKLSKTATSEYKLTIIDSSRSFTATASSTTVKPSGTVTIDYTGATIGEYVSAMIVKNGVPMYYGRLVQPTSTSGTISFTLPADIEMGECTLKLFSEQYNGDYKTDYASNFVDIILTVANIYDVTFDNNGHGTAPDSVQVPAGGNISLPANPIEDGWKFEGWYTKDGTDGDWGDKVTGSTVVNQDMTIYGKWKYVGPQTSIMNGTDAIGGYNSVTDSYDYIYYGWDVFVLNSNKWRVLDTTSNDGITNAIFMLSEGVFEGSVADSNNLHWADSEIKAYINSNLLNQYIREKEQDAIMSTYLTETLRNNVEPVDLTGEKLFLLSMSEIGSEKYFGRTGDGDHLIVNGIGSNVGTSWWLRSVSPLNIELGLYEYYYVNEIGTRLIGDASVSRYIRPAMNLDPSKVLFTSDAVGGKPTTTVGTLEKIVLSNTSEHKLTLLDSSREFAVTDMSDKTTKKGGVVTVNYTGANVGTNEYISAMIMKSGYPVYYGRVFEPTTANGSFSFNVPENINNGEYTLRIFSEQYNGDKMTDYASNFYDIKLTIEMDMISLGATAIKSYNSETNTYDYVYFGTYEEEPIKWRVLSDFYDENIAPGMESLVLLSEYVLENRAFDTNSTDWSTSDIKTYLNGTFYNTSFTDLEQWMFGGPSEITDEEIELGGVTYEERNITSYSSVYLPSVNEMIKTEYGFTNSEGSDKNREAYLFSDHTILAGDWWLRSTTNNNMAIIKESGSIFVAPTTDFLGVRPMIYVCTNGGMEMILFTSAAEGGKPTSTIGTMEKLSTVASDGYKLTMIDWYTGERDSFSVETTPISAKKGDLISINYSNAAVGTNEYISGMIVDKNNKPVYYGRLVQPTSVSGILTFNLPSDMEIGEYTLKLFSEQYNGDYKTDFASDFVNVSLTISNEHTITFDNNGHGTAPDSVQVLAGGNISLPANPIENGWKFEGWYTKDGTDGDWGEKVTGSTTVNEDMTIYGKWEYVGPQTSIMNGADAIDGYNSVDNTYDYIYYGTFDGEPIKWRVLDTTSNDGSTPAIFMLSEYALERRFFEENYGNSRWELSEIKAYLQGSFYNNNFTAEEQNTILFTSTQNDLEVVDVNGMDSNILSPKNLINEKIFLLSASEVLKSKYGFTSSTGSTPTRESKLVTDKTGTSVEWWLRSTFDVGENSYMNVGYLEIDGEVTSNFCDWNGGVRPAMNIDPSKILFTSAAVGGKPTTTVGTLEKIIPSNTSEHKLTLLDSSREFAVTDMSDKTTKKGGSVTVNYSGANVGTNEYISAMIMKSGYPVYYGRVFEPTTANGSFSFNVPENINNGEYTLRIFSEQYNGDYKTDYASNYVDINLTVDSEPVDITLGTGAVDGYNSSTNSYEYVYYGTYNSKPIKWRVLDTTSNDGVTDAIFMLSEYLLDIMEFDVDGESNNWETSSIKRYIQEDLYNSSFTTEEKNTILSTTTTKDTAVQGVFSTIGAVNLTGEKIFLLSASEVTTTKYGFSTSVDADENRVATWSPPYDDEKDYWWLRSSVDDTDPGCVEMESGCVSSMENCILTGLRPAMNLDPSKILFTSPAVGGKPTTTLGQLDKLSKTATSEYKLTIIDSSRSFTATASSTTVKPSGTVTIDYTGATIGEYVSAMIVKNGVPMYYGRLVQPTSTSGNVTLTLPADIEMGECTLKLFSEQYNGDYKTDYASNFVDITLTVANIYDVTFDGNGHGTDPDSIQVPEGGNISLPTNPIEDGWKFEGWYTKDGTAGDWGDKVTGSTVVNQDMTIYGKWEYVGSQTSIMNGADAIDGYNSVDNTYDYIYYGTFDGEPIKWRVLDTTSNDGSTPAIFMLSEYSLEERAFDTEHAGWETSEIKTYLQEDFYNNFSVMEKSIILGTTVTTDKDVEYDNDVLEATNLNNEKIFLLSVIEVRNIKYGFSQAMSSDVNRVTRSASDPTGDTVRWWLRSSLASGYDVGEVLSDGTVDYFIVDAEEGVRPAMNIDPSKILFTSAAVGGKPTTTVGTLEKIVSSNTSEHKLTLLDSTREFVVTDMSDMTAKKGGAVTVNYSGANVGTNEYISAMIMKSGYPVYYGRVFEPTTANGSFSFNVPENINNGEYTLRIFSEQYNGDKMTDYASNFYDIKLTVDTVQSDITLGTGAVDGYDSTTDSYKYIYYGTDNGDPIKWRVLDTVSNDGITNGLFVLTENVLRGANKFNSNAGLSTSNQWSTSELKTYLQNESDNNTFISKSLTEIERNSVLSTTTNNDLAVGNYGIVNLENEKIFVLSVAEITNPKYGFDRDPLAYDANRITENRSYWLRSPNNNSTSYVAAVHSGGDVINNFVDGMAPVWPDTRPAMNIDSSKILFTSPAVGGKPTTTVGNLEELPKTATDEYKVTLIDTSRTFSVTTSVLEAEKGKNVTIWYNNATTGANEYISAMIMQNDKAIYYGRIKAVTSSNGQLSFKMPDDILIGEYTMYIFSEQYNGDYKTDYASAFKQITLTVVTDKSYTVSFDNKGHGTTPENVRVPDGGVLILPAEPSEEGWVFEGWYTKDGSTDGDWGEEFTGSTGITEDKNIFGKWEVDTSTPVNKPDTSEANAPEVYQGLHPIKYSANGEIIFTNESDSGWYNYTTGKWANAVTVGESGELTKENITGYYVWIPRYAYLIRSGYNTSETGRIDILFLEGSTNIDQYGKEHYTISSLENEAEKWEELNTISYIGDRQMEYLVHPAFDFDGDVAGIWIAKYEASKGDGDKVMSLPNRALWGELSVKDSFDKVKAMKDDSSYGFSANADTHLIKPTEYGAAVYLDHSIYGAQAQYEVRGLDMIKEFVAGYKTPSTILSGEDNKYTNVYEKDATGSLVDVKGSAYLETSNGSSTWNNQTIQDGEIVVKGNEFGVVSSDGTAQKDIGFRAVIIEK